MMIPGVKCEHPLSLPVESKKDGRIYGIAVPCLHCRLCRSARAREWSLRIKMESKDYDREDIVFSTLTYDEDHVPKFIHSVRPPFGLQSTLWPIDEKNFMKRLRRRLDYPVRFVCCGEYGERTHRPHLHFIIFGLKPEDWHFVGEAWRKGFVLNKSFYNETAGYVAQYIQKKLFGNDVYDSQIPPFWRCSQNPSIGENEFWRNAATICKQGFIMSDGYKHSIPRPFLRKAIDPKVCLEHGYEKPLLPESDLDEIQLTQNLRIEEWFEHMDSQSVEISDYERNFLELVRYRFDKSNYTRDFNEVV